MLFSSMTFIFVFLPVVLLLHLVTKKEFHNSILLIASIIFYAWGEPKYLAVMLTTIIVNYCGAILIEKFSAYKKHTLILTILADLGFLFYFKYFDFILKNINSICHANIDLLGIVLPIGISFYTFQAMSYLIDVYRGEVQAQKDFYKVALYISLFPQLVAGPIVKYHDIEDQITSREIDFEKVNYGVKRFITGLAKKVLLANTFALVADKVFVQAPDTFTSAIAWLGAIAYTLQIYFDFCGYSDMAIGLGSIFGFRFMENFNYPYISKSITEFWRRWHISLSTWFKQYVYISLGGNKNGLIKTCRNLGIVFLLTGIWHGANWTFILWGIWHGFFIIIEKILNIKEYESKKHPVWQEALRYIYCMLVVIIGWVLFRADNLAYAVSYIRNMFGLLEIQTDKILYLFPYYADRIEIIMFIAAILCIAPLFKNIFDIQDKRIKVLVNIWLLTLFFLSTCTLAAGTYNPFIYFQF